MDVDMRLINLNSNFWKLESKITTSSAFKPVLEPKIEDRDETINEINIESYVI